MVHLLTTTRRKLLTLSMLLAMLVGGVNSAWAENADFENSLPDGWETVGTMTYYERPKTGSYSIGNSAGSGWDTNRGNYIKTTKLDGDLTFWIRSYKERSTGYVVLFKLSDDGETVGDKLVAFSSSSTTFSEKSYTLTEPTRLAIVINYAHLDNMTYTPYVQADGPVLTVKDGVTKITSPFNYEFGLATAGTNHTFTLSNSGTAAIDGLSVSETGNFGATLSANTIAAGGEATLTVTMPEATGSSTITISSTTDGIDDFIINVSGTLKDPTKLFVDFADNALPDGWEAAASSTYYSWSFSNGYASYSGSSSYAGTLKSPLLTFTAGEKFYFSTSGSSSWYSPSISVQTSADGSTWTTVQTYTDDEYNVWKTRSIEIASADVKYVRFSGWYINIDNIYGGKLPDGAKFAISPSETTTSFGFVEKNALAANTYNVTNNGSSDLSINFTESGDFSVANTVAFTKPSSWSGSKLYLYAWNSEGALTAAWPGDEVTNAAQNGFGEWVYTAAIPDGATAIIFNDGNNQTSDISTNGFKKFVGLYLDGSTVKQWKNEDVFTVPAASNASFSIKMNTATAGEKTGSVALAFDALNATSHAIQATGYVADPEVILVDFADNTIPEGWENSGFNIENNEITTTYNPRTLTSPAITVAEGQKLVIFAKGESTYGAKITVKTSTDNGNSWTTAKEFTTELRQNTTDYVVLTVDNIAAGDYKLQFEGYYVTINAINGYTYNQNAPVMEVTPTEDFAAGVVTANATKTYTVKNVGTGTLTVNIASDNEQFTVSPAQLVVTDEAKEFTVTFNVEEGVFGKFNANITVTPTYDETAKVTFAASATVKNPDVWEEDFEEGTLPTGWENTAWTVDTFLSYENTTKMALAPNSSTAGTLTTPRLKAKANDVLTWDAYLNWYDEALIVEYSTDNKITWIPIYNYKTEDDAEAPSTTKRYYHKEMSFTAPADGYYYLRFTSTWQNGVDNFSGFKLDVPEHDIAKTDLNIPTTGIQYVEYTATITMKEMAGKNEELTATFYIDGTQYGEAVTETLEANGTKTFTVTFTPEEAISGEASFVVENDDVKFKSDKIDVTIAAAPTLDETAGELSNFEDWGNYPVIVLKYSLKAGWNTIILPFAVSDLSVFGEGVKAYNFNGYEDGKLNFNATTSLNVQTPYILYAEEAKSEIIFKKVTQFRNSTEAADLRITSNGATFQGTYAQMEMAGKWGITPDGHIAKGGADATMKGFRAYFELPEGATAPVLSLEDGPATSISLTPASAQAEEVYYDLNGRRVEKPTKGLYIINGKKVMVK